MSFLSSIEHEHQGIVFMNFADGSVKSYFLPPWFQNGKVYFYSYVRACPQFILLKRLFPSSPERKMFFLKSFFGHDHLHVLWRNFQSLSVMLQKNTESLSATNSKYSLVVSIVPFLKSVRIGSYSDSYFPELKLNAERYGVSLRIHSKYRKILTRRTSNTDTFHTVANLIQGTAILYQIFYCNFYKRRDWPLKFSDF